VPDGDQDLVAATGPRRAARQVTTETRDSDARCEALTTTLPVFLLAPGPMAPGFIMIVPVGENSI
jgi:hypothetical protein